MDIFYTATMISLVNGEKTPFWNAPWLDGRKPKDIAPLIFESSKRKYWPVCQALVDDAWIRRVNLEQIVTMNHITQFAELWALIQDVHLAPDRDDNILWKFTESGIYTTKLAYNM
jgi:hypothetical protein